jgi:hypothetical protein
MTLFAAAGFGRAALRPRYLGDTFNVSSRNEPWVSQHLREWISKIELVRVNPRSHGVISHNFDLEMAVLFLTKMSLA